MEVKIRQAKNNEEDAPLFGELYRKNYLEENKTIYGKEFKDIGLEPGKAELGVTLRSGHIILLAESEKGEIGYLQGSIYNNAERGEVEGEIDDIFVLKDYRKQGIGAKLVEKFKEILKSQGHKQNRIVLTSSPLNLKQKEAIKFFENLDFEVQAKVYGKEIK